MLLLSNSRVYLSKPTNGKQTNHKASTSPRKHRGEATPNRHEFCLSKRSSTTPLTAATISGLQHKLKWNINPQPNELIRAGFFFVSFPLDLRNTTSLHYSIEKEIGQIGGADGTILA